MERLTKEGGEEGRTKINKYTKILTIVLALIEGLGIFFSYKSSGIFLDTSFMGGALTVISLMAGTALLIWLGEQITNKGIGNGISMIIFVGIISGLPRGITAVWGLMFSAGTFSTVGFIKALALVVGLLVLVAGVVFIQIAERRIPVQYAKKVVGRRMVGAQNTHIPLGMQRHRIKSAWWIVFGKLHISAAHGAYAIWASAWSRETAWRRIRFRLFGFISRRWKWGA